MALLRKGYTLMFVLGDKGDPQDKMHMCSFMPSGFSCDGPCLGGAPTEHEMGTEAPVLLETVGSLLLEKH